MLSPRHQILDRLNGSYNLVFIVEFEDGLKYVVRTPSTGWGDRFSDAARDAFESQALTMRYVGENTAMPIPTIYAFDATFDNEIGAPYIVMSFVPGSTVHSLWFKKDGPTPVEKRRKRILETVAQAMTQLQRLQFDKIGCLQFASDTDLSEPSIGPLYSYDEGKTDSDFAEADGPTKLEVKQFGPFKTSKSYLNHWLNGCPESPKTPRGQWNSMKLMETLISHFPSSTSITLRKLLGDSSKTFVLNVPDFDSQNFMVDEEGNLTSIIDWDMVQTVLRCLGYPCYPGWITRDWDPIMYGWPHSPDSENSPEELEQYRSFYYSQMKLLLKGNGDLRFTSKSHLFEAVAIAAANDINRLEIIKKILSSVVTEEELDAKLTYDLELIEFWGKEGLEPHLTALIKELDQRLKVLLTVQPFHTGLLGNIKSFLHMLGAWDKCS